MSEKGNNCPKIERSGWSFIDQLDQLDDLGDLPGKEQVT